MSLNVHLTQIFLAIRTATGGTRIIGQRTVFAEEVKAFRDNVVLWPSFVAGRTVDQFLRVSDINETPIVKCMHNV